MDAFDNDGRGTPVVLSRNCKMHTVLFADTGLGSLKHRNSGKCLHLLDGSVKKKQTLQLVLKEGCARKSAKFDFIKPVAPNKGSAFDITKRQRCLTTPRRGLVARFFSLVPGTPTVGNRNPDGLKAMKRKVLPKGMFKGLLGKLMRNKK